jgi:hypothetical protein
MFLPRSSRTSILAPAACAIILLVGCDQGGGDRQAREDVRKSHELALAGTEEANTEAKQRLELAAGNNEASPAVQANAKSLLAQLELDAARTAQRSIDQKMMDVSRAVADITQLAQQIATTNALVAGYQQYDPRPTLEAIEKSIADATGGPDKPAWFTHEDTTINTLTVLREQITKLEAEIAALQAKLDELGQQRTAVLAEADQASRAAEGNAAEQTLDAFKRASELRKQAADLAVEIDRTQAAMVPLRNDLAVAQSQAQVIEGLIADLRQRAQAQTQGWQMIQQQMAAQTGLSRSILQGAGGGAGGASTAPIGGAISDKAAQLGKILEEIKTLREDAVTNARNAAEHYGQAVTQAESLRQSLSQRIGDPKNEGRSEIKSWTTMRDVMHPATFRLHQAAALRTLASLQGSEATEHTMRIELRNLLVPILEAAGLQMPDALQAPNLERDREQTLTAANEAYKEADELLQNITEGQAQPEVQNAAYVARILTLYGWSQLNRANGDERGAQERLELAREIKNAATERQIALPALPEGLGGAPATAPAAADPATAPATAPATDAPADAPAAAPTDAPAAPPAETPAAPAGTPPTGTPPAGTPTPPADEPR